MADQLNRVQEACIDETWFLMRIHTELTFPVFEFQVCVEPWTFINILVDGSELEAAREVSGQRSVQETIQSVLAACRKRFSASSPRFWHKIKARLTSSGIHLEQVPFIQDFGVLPKVDELRRESLNFEGVPVVFIKDLETVRDRGQYLPAGVRIVRHQDHEYIAKGPVYPLHLDHFTKEMENLVSLPSHSGIIDGPLAFIAPDNALEYACGYLMPFYPNGNLDTYSQMRHAGGCLTLAEILRWFREAIEALLYLFENRTWHGDLKPDNLLVTEDGSICLTDLTRSMATSITASPEVRAYCNKQAPDQNVLLGVPPEWSIEEIASSEIYSLGRTIFLVMTCQSMMDVYEQYGWVSNHNFVNSFCDQADCRSALGIHAEAVKATKDLVLSCLRKRPSDRPSPESLLTSIASLEEKCCAENILLKASKDRICPTL